MWFRRLRNNRGSDREDSQRSAPGVLAFETDEVFGTHSRRGGLDLVELSAHMAPAESERDIAGLGELGIC